MTLTLIYSFLAGFSELFGLLGHHAWSVLGKVAGESSSILNISVLLGLINGLLLFVIRNKVNISKPVNYLCYGLVSVGFSELLSYFGLVPGLRVGGFIFLISAVVLYLQNTSFEGLAKSPTLWLFIALLAPVAYLPVGLILLSIVQFEFKKSRQLLINLSIFQIPLILLAVVRESLDFEVIENVNAVSVVLSYLSACLGVYLGFFGVLKCISIRRPDILKQLLTGLGCFVLFVTSRYGDVTQEFKSYGLNFSSMGTVCELTIWATNKSDAEKVLLKSRELMDSIEERLSTYKPESELSILNKTAHLKPIECQPVLWENLQVAKAAYEISNGAFDVTIGPLVKLWGVKRKRSELPTEEEVLATRKLVGFDKLIIDYEKRTVKFPEEGFKIDFGALTKGWAVDKVAGYLTQQGITKGLINLGGNIYCLSEAPPKKDNYKIGIKNPLKPEQLHMTVGLLGQGIATSGNYEQFTMIDGKRFTHIIDPRTGYPVNIADGVSVIYPSAAWCDILSTAIFVEGPTLIEELSKKYRSLNIWFVKKQADGEVINQTYGEFWQGVTNPPLE
ncbi:MAG: FAD:protein FMN transferase [Lentisphaeraceae bacterium]|nr:FAD:protein FMN transferase [Lentisphaeraceae bacterium]